MQFKRFKRRRKRVVTDGKRSVANVTPRLVLLLTACAAD